MDHKTLINFDTQRDLSQRQLRWQELMSQYELNITYIPSDDNTVANALSRLPDETAAPTDLHAVWNASINATSCITTDLSVLEAIKTGYATDDFCQ